MKHANIIKPQQCWKKSLHCSFRRETYGEIIGSILRVGGLAVNMVYRTRPMLMMFENDRLGTTYTMTTAVGRVYTMDLR